MSLSGTPTERRGPLRLAMIQMRVAGGRAEEILARAERLVGEAAHQGAQVILLPEALDLGWTHPSSSTAAGPVPGGASYERLAACARRHSVYLCAGLVERAGTQIFNAAILFGTDGSLLLRHPKINELEIGHEFYALGERLQVVNTPLVAFGVMICADAFAPAQVISRTLAMMGAQVILSPCARAVPADHNNVREPCGQLWRDNYGPVARDFKIWIAGTSNVGVLEAGPLGGEKMHRVFAAHRSGWRRRAYGTLRCGGADDTFRGHPAPAATRSGGRLGGSDSQQSLTKWSR